MTVEQFISRLDRECQNRNMRIEIKCPNGLLVDPQIGLKWNESRTSIVGYVIHWR